VAAYYSSNNLGTPPTIGALAYSDVFLPPPTWELSSSPTTSGNGPLMASNILIEICQYGSPNLPMTSAPNAAFKAAMDSWHNLAQASGFKLGNYDYSLLHTDLWQQNPEFPVPLVYGTVDHANYLSSIGALEGGVQANVSSLPYNPWNFYAYPRIRQNMTLTAAQIENEFFTSYFKEASAHMLAYYQTMENWQVQNSVNMWDKGYNYSIMQGSFPNQILNTMYLDLQKAQSDAQSAPWFIKQRVANIAAGFQWILNQLNLQNSDLTNTTEYQTALNPNNAAKTLNLLYGVIPQYLAPGDNSAYINDGGGGACTSSTTGYTLSSHCTNTPPPSPSWGILGGDIYEPLYFSQAGTYHIAMQVKGNANSQFTVYLGPQNLGTITLPATPTLSTYTINASVPDGFGVQDLWMHNSGGSVTIYNITVSLATSGPSNLGDVNGAVDGNGNPVVSIVDAEETAQEAIGVDVPGFITANALVDNGTSVDINDAYLIAEYAVKKITTFPASSA